MPGSGWFKTEKIERTYHGEDVLEYNYRKNNLVDRNTHAGWNRVYQLYSTLVDFFFFLFNTRSIFVTASSWIACWYCLKHGIAYDINLSFVSVCVIFPLSFCISSGYKRREAAAEVMASLKSNILCLYWTYEDWNLSPDLNERKAVSRQCWKLMDTFCAHLTPFLYPFGHKQAAYVAIYETFRELNILNEVLCRKSGYSRGGEGGMSRAAQYVRYMIYDFERLRKTRDYSLPLGLIDFAAVMSFCLPPFLAPVYAYQAVENCASDNSENQTENCTSAGYQIAFIVSLLFSTLYQINEDLRDPYDNAGSNDIRYDKLRLEMRFLMSLSPSNHRHDPTSTIPPGQVQNITFKDELVVNDKVQKIQRHGITKRPSLKIDTSTEYDKDKNYQTPPATPANWIPTHRIEG
jgi:hypothetical protein